MVVRYRDRPLVRFNVGVECDEGAQDGGLVDRLLSAVRHIVTEETACLSTSTLGSGTHAMTVGYGGGTGFAPSTIGRARAEHQRAGG